MPSNKNKRKTDKSDKLHSTQQKVPKSQKQQEKSLRKVANNF